MKINFQVLKVQIENKFIKMKKRIVPLNCSESEFGVHLISTGEITLEKYLTAMVDNIPVRAGCRPIRSNVPWNFEEDYQLVKLTFDFKTTSFIGKVFRRSELAIKTRLVYLFGTSDWIKLITLPSGKKRTILIFFELCLTNSISYDNRPNILETVEMIEFLHYYGFDADDSNRAGEGKTF